jgi:hypothetical protein
LCKVGYLFERHRFLTLRRPNETQDQRPRRRARVAAS